MKIFPTSWSFESEKNGRIDVVEWLWSAQVYGGGFEQSGSYVTALWKQALKKIHHPNLVKRVLVLGVCAGDNIRLAQRRFKNAEIIAVEWDKKMIDLAAELKRFKPVTMLYGDLRAVLPTLEGQFDLILGDAFYNDASEGTEDDPTFGKTLTRLLAPDGVYILNAVHRFESIDYVSKYLTLKKQWLFRVNKVTLFTH
ncbi:MAG: methyltransferase domain-containing protein [Candidatus Adlerbacteria bacterium]|nr:methyltransferase domain-containing protein [Candidatus Adlerbacteria bacterium]